MEFGTLVGTVPVAPPPDAAPPADTSRAVPPRTRGPQQGAQVTIVDVLTSDELTQGNVPSVEPGTLNVEPGTRNAELGTRNEAPPLLRRFYTAFPRNPRGRIGPPGAQAELTLVAVPDPPASVDVAYDEEALRLTWDPSGGVIGFLLERPLPEEPLPFDLEEITGTTEPAPPQGPVLYNVYRTTSPDPFAPPAEDAGDEEWNSRPPTPINPAPLSTFEFLDAIAFNEERCYTVRGVRGVGPDMRVGAPSGPACVIAVDTFPPEPPSGLATVASEGTIDLIWEPNTERDLGGYLVLRGEAPGDTLQPLTSTPIREARYRDHAVSPGLRYVYAVVAIDNRFPVPNLSDVSERAEETAR
jgi:hypothetical protein